MTSSTASPTDVGVSTCNVVLIPNRRFDLRREMAATVSDSKIPLWWGLGEQLAKLFPTPTFSNFRFPHSRVEVRQAEKPGSGACKIAPCTSASTEACWLP